MKGPIVRNRDTAMYLGALAYLIGTVMLWDAFENRGRDRPKTLRVFDAFRGLF